MVILFLLHELKQPKIAEVFPPDVLHLHAFELDVLLDGVDLALPHPLLALQLLDLELYPSDRLRERRSATVNQRYIRFRNIVLSAYLLCPNLL